jgi:hypothetical protein
MILTEHSYMSGAALEFSSSILFSSGARNKAIDLFAKYWQTMKTNFRDVSEVVGLVKSFCKLRMDRDLQEYVRSFRIMPGRVSLPIAAVCHWFRQGLSYWMQEKLSGYVENSIDDLIEQAKCISPHCSVARASKIQGK